MCLIVFIGTTRCDIEYPLEDFVEILVIALAVAIDIACHHTFGVVLNASIGVYQLNNLLSAILNPSEHFIGIEISSVYFAEELAVDISEVIHFVASYPADVVFYDSGDRVF